MAARFFEACKGYKTEDIQLPKRSTENSAGYDFLSVEDTIIPSFWSNFFKLITGKHIEPVLVKTGVKAKMRVNEVLMLYNRSSNPKRGLILANGVGVVDSDYYSNPQNDGEICFAFFSLFPWKVTLPKGTKIGQGVFQTFLKTDEDKASGKREGGFGSTGS